MSSTMLRMVWVACSVPFTTASSSCVMRDMLWPWKPPVTCSVAISCLVRMIALWMIISSPLSFCISLSCAW